MRWCLVVLVVAVFPASAAAQTAPERRNVVFGAVGHARTVDDEGMLGTGAALGAGIGRRLTERLTVQAVVDRIPYRRDAGYLEFDGRVLYVGAEAAFERDRPKVRPFVTVGAGVMHDRKRWTHRVPTRPGGPYRDDAVTEHEYTLAAMRASGGVELRLTEALWLRTGATLHGLLDSGDDLAAHLIVQPTAALSWRW